MKKSLYFSTMSLLILASIVLSSSGCSKSKDPIKIVKTQTTSTVRSSWTVSDPYSYITISCPDITADVLENGAVLVYVKDADNYQALPLSYGPGQLNYTMTTGSVTITWTLADLTPPGDGLDMDFKIVVIPSSAKKADAGIDTRDYAAVEKAFQLAK